MKDLLGHLSSLTDEGESLLFYSPKVVLVATMQNLGKVAGNDKRKRKRPVKGSLIVTDRRLVILKIRGSKISESKRYELLIDPNYAETVIKSINQMIIDAKDGKDSAIPKRKLRKMKLLLLSGINLKNSIIGKRIWLNIFTVIFGKTLLNVANATNKALKVLSFGLGTLKEMTFTLTFKKPLTMNDAARKVLMMMLPAGLFIESRRDKAQNKANTAYEELVSLLEFKVEKMNSEKARLQEIVNVI